MPFEAFNQAWFAELLAFIVGRFVMPSVVERKSIAGNELPFCDRATPCFEKTKHGSTGFQPFDCTGRAAAREQRDGRNSHIVTATSHGHIRQRIRQVNPTRQSANLALARAPSPN